MPEHDRPSVVFVITDDQGYGDLACHGNPIIQTPCLDKLHAQSVRLTNFHVGPTCAPTRAGIMTGRYYNCTGVWHTIMGRSLLRANETTMADVFLANGYRTGMFGKWHLGDNYPFRPHDRGFEVALYHGGGGVSQTPDWWGNDYFDDTYRRNGVPEPHQGYCTDVWSDEAMKFIEENRDRPFFCYLSTNAPHAPYNVPGRYAGPYRGQVPDDRARFYGMITCIDDNMGRLRAKLRELGIEQNTILIFMTDNGTACGCRVDKGGFVTDGYNCGMRGMKGWEYDGGHRTPLFLHWPAGGFTQGRDVGRLTANIDVLPTLVELCGLDAPEALDCHGTSIVPLLRGQEDEEWPDRIIVTDSQRVEYPIKWRRSATMTDRWRLVNGVELHGIRVDPEQRNDVAAEHPDVVEYLREHYERWWELVSATFDDDCPIVIGSAQETESTLTSHDWHGQRRARNQGGARWEPTLCAWNQGQIREGLECNGYWIVEFAEAGRYEFDLHRWPREEDRALGQGIPGELTDWYHGGRALPLTRARIRVGDQEAEAVVDPQAKGVTFEFDVPAGLTRVQTWFEGQSDLSLGAYYVYARRHVGRSSSN